MERLHTLLNLLKIIRLHIVLGGVLAFTLGLFLGLEDGGSFNFISTPLFYAIVFFGDLSTHFSNDYFDVDQDKYVGKFKFFSGRRILIKHPRLLPYARRIAITLLSISILIAALLVIFGLAQVELLFIVLAANFLGWFYSAPPFRLVSRGLGEVAIALAVGFAIPAMGYISVRGYLDGLFWLFVLPFVLYGFVLALSLEAPDMEVDRKSNRKNFGASRGEHAVFLLVLGAASGAFLWMFFNGWLLSEAQVVFWATAFAAVPLAAAIAGFLGARERKRIDIYCAVNILTLFAFNLLMIVYLALIAL